MDQKIEIKEQANEVSVEPIDLLSGEYIFHWTSVDKIPSILSKGLLSPKFASRIASYGYRAFLTHSDADSSVYFSPTIEGYSHVLAQTVGYDRAVAVAIKSPYGHGKLRVPPRKFVGLVVDDQTQERPDHKEEIVERALSSVGKIMDVCNKEGIQLLIPIYGSSGNQYWPECMSHEEIVQMLAGKQEPEGVI